MANLDAQIGADQDFGSLHLPILDLSARDEARNARELLQAATEWGFVYIRCSGLELAPSHVENIFELVRCASRCTECPGDPHRDLVRADKFG